MDDLKPLSLLGEETLDGEVHAFVIFSKDPHYHLGLGPSGKRRWLFGGVHDETTPVSSWDNPPKHLLGDIKSFREFPALEREGKGHSPLYIVQDTRGHPFVVKWTNANEHLLSNMTSKHARAMKDALGTDDPVALVDEYGKLFSLFGVPAMPQWSVGSYAELREREPELYEEIEAWVGKKYGFKPGSPTLENIFRESPHIIASPYAPPEEVKLPGEWFGHTDDAIDHNLSFLWHKQGQADHLIGVPDRHANNIISYDVVKPNGDIRKLGVGIDFDWFPVSPSSIQGGAYVGGWSSAAYGLGRKGVEGLAEDALTSTLIPAAMLKDDDYEELAYKGVLRSNAGAEASLDLISRLGEASQVPRGPVPKAFFKILDEKARDWSAPESKHTLNEFVELWEQVREERAREGVRLYAAEGTRFFVEFSKDPKYYLKQVGPGVRRWVRREGSKESVVDEGGRLWFENQDEAARFAAHVIKAAADPEVQSLEVEPILWRMEEKGWIDPRDSARVMAEEFSTPDAVADGLVGGAGNGWKYVTYAAKEKLADPDFVREVYKSAGERYATPFPPPASKVYRNGEFKEPYGKIEPAYRVRSALLGAFSFPDMEQHKVAKSAYLDLMVDEDDGGLVSARTREDRKRSWLEAPSPAEQLVGEMDADSWEDAREQLIDSHDLFLEYVVRDANNRGFTTDPIGGGSLFVDDIMASDGRSLVNDRPSPVGGPGIWRAAREKTLDIAQRMHESPVMVINRTPSDIHFMEKLYKGEYPIMDPHAEGGSHLERIHAENGAGLGRVIYGALGFDGVLNFDGAANPYRALRSEMDAWVHDDGWETPGYIGPYEIKAAQAALRDPNMADLGNNTWGNVQTVWVPPELKEGGVSYAVGDSFVDPAYGNERLPYAILGRAMEASFLPALSYPDNRGGFIELHLDRPMRVEDDLKRIIYRAHTHHIPPTFWRRGEPAASPMFGEVGAAISPRELESLFPWAERASTPVEVFIPTLHPAVVDEAKEYADEIDDFLRKKTGGMATLLRPWEEK